ncbi:uncharacterized protein LOC120139293 [Hibiscus syriacus]|uniref:uncharacterized protein LOC120139293 n=1 Tax=Hibiscus syriacus TaxID=106335 RepID=UPI0019217873|nr:uncharacterized protein LOC120139293 [Hibiscus syriacus]
MLPLRKLSVSLFSSIHRWMRTTVPRSHLRSRTVAGVHTRLPKWSFSALKFETKPLFFLKFTTKNLDLEIKELLLETLHVPDDHSITTSETLNPKGLSGSLFSFVHARAELIFQCPPQPKKRSPSVKTRSLASSSKSFREGDQWSQGFLMLIMRTGGPKLCTGCTHEWLRESGDVGSF